MTKQSIKHFFAVLVCCFVIPLHAYEINDYFRIDGFGTLGVTATPTPDITLLSFPQQREGAQQGKANLFQNSYGGLQAALNLTHGFSATVQGVLVNTDTWTYERQLEWAFLTYDTGYGFQFRLGRFRLPIFESTELTYVGYARTWARPALIFYGVTTYNQIDGANINYSTYAGDVDMGVSLYYGYQKSHAPNNAFDIQSYDMKIVKLTLGYAGFNGAFTLYNANNSLTGSFGQSVKNTTTMLAFEGSYTYGDFTLEGAYGRANSSAYIVNEIPAYIGTYYQLGDFRPYLLYSSMIHLTNATEFGPPAAVTTGAPPPPAPSVSAPPKNDNLHQNTYSVGVRYDFWDQADIKLQFDIYNNSSLAKPQNAQRGNAVGATFVLDFVF